jgi:hypothetical protein
MDSGYQESVTQRNCSVIIAIRFVSARQPGNRRKADKVAEDENYQLPSEFLDWVKDL